MKIVEIVLSLVLLNAQAVQSFPQGKLEDNHDYEVSHVFKEIDERSNDIGTANNHLQKRQESVVQGGAKLAFSGLRNRLAGKAATSFASSSAEGVELTQIGEASSLMEGIVEASAALEGEALAEAATAIVAGAEASALEAGSGIGVVLVPFTLLAAAGIGAGIFFHSLMRNAECEGDKILQAVNGHIQIVDTDCIDKIADVIKSKEMCETFEYDPKGSDCHEEFTLMGSQCVWEKRDGCDTFIHVISDKPVQLNEVCVGDNEDECGKIEKFEEKVLHIPDLSGKNTTKNQVYISNSIPFERFAFLDQITLKFDNELDCNWVSFAVTHKGSTAGFKEDEVFMYDDIYASLCPAVNAPTEKWTSTVIPLSRNIPELFDDWNYSSWEELKLEHDLLGCPIEDDSKPDLVSEQEHEMPCFCSNVLAPVCVNDKSYNNKCSAECEIGDLTEIQVTEGQCEGDSSQGENERPDNSEIVHLMKKRDLQCNPGKLMGNIFAFEMLRLGTRYFGLWDEFQVADRFARRKFQSGVVDFMVKDFNENGFKSFNKEITCSKTPSNSLSDAAGGLEECPSQSQTVTETESEIIIIYRWFVFLKEDATEKDIDDTVKICKELLEESTKGKTLLYDELAPELDDQQQVPVGSISSVIVNLPKIVIPLLSSKIPEFNSTEAVVRLSMPETQPLDDQDILELEEALAELDLKKPKLRKRVISGDEFHASLSPSVYPFVVLRKMFDSWNVEEYSGEDVNIHVIEPANLAKAQEDCPDAKITEHLPISPVNQTRIDDELEKNHGNDVIRTICSEKYGGFATRVNIHIWYHDFTSESIVQSLDRIKPGNSPQETSEEGIHVVTMSLNYGQGIDWAGLLSYGRTFQVLSAVGIPVIVSAGNHEKPYVEAPGGDPNVITVGASNLRHKPYCFSNYGRAVDLFGLGLTTSNGVGTSFAAPRVAAILALILGEMLKQTENLASDMLQKIRLRMAIMDRTTTFGEKHDFWKHLTQDKLKSRTCEDRDQNWLDSSQTTRTVLGTTRDRFEQTVDYLTEWLNLFQSPQRPGGLDSDDEDVPVPNEIPGGLDSDDEDGTIQPAPEPPLSATKPPSCFNLFSCFKAPKTI